MRWDHRLKRQISNKRNQDWNQGNQSSNLKRKKKQSEERKESKYGQTVVQGKLRVPIGGLA